MINAKELEKRWYRYKAKGFILIFSIFSIFMILVYGAYYIFFKSDLNIGFTKQEEKKIDTIKIIKESNNTKIESVVTVKEEKKIESNDEVMLSPTIPIVDLEGEKMRERRREIQNRKRLATKKRVKERPKLVKAKRDTYLTAKELNVVNGHSIKKRETKKINLNGTTNNYMSIMKKKFEQNKNPREALLIAKAYYKAGNYKKSEKWALVANNLDKKLDESWLIFASSQEKLGRREEALKILTAYYYTSKSVKAKALINKIKTESI